MTVESRGYVEIDPESPSGLRIQPNMLAAQADVDALVASVEIALELADQPGFAQLVKDRAAPGEDLSKESLTEFVRNSAMPYFHPVGTCAMGTDDAAVVDPELRVHGLSGLRVADASIMPSITSGNTNAPTVMIAEKAADLISGTVADDVR
jgi:choline dehydrogenase